MCIIPIERNDDMKKAHIKVKPKITKRVTGRAYILATVLSATLCAFVFFFLFSAKDNINEEIKVDVPNVTPEEIAQVSEPVEVEIPVTEEIKNELKIEIEKPEPAQNTEVFTNNETEFLKPTDGEIINDYSNGKPVKSETMGDWRVHSGIDIKAEIGTMVKSPQDGKVLISENNKLTGNTVVIEHKNGYVSTIYNLESISVSKGENVEKGAVIGTVGKSAPLENAMDAHVHFEIKKNGKFVNPNDYIK